MIGFPYNSDKILSINTADDSVSYFESDLGQREKKWAGGAVGMNGLIYSCPHEAEQLHPNRNTNTNTNRDPNANRDRNALTVTLTVSVTPTVSVTLTVTLTRIEGGICFGY